jgi:hypothetical protein
MAWDIHLLNVEGNKTDLSSLNGSNRIRTDVADHTQPFFRKYGSTRINLILNLHK